MSIRRSTHSHGWRKHGAILALYALLSLVLTWPLASRFATHVTGDGIDDPSLAWNLWWLNERLITQLNPKIFDVEWMFFPIRINLAFYTLTPLNGLLSVPLQNGLSLVLANNLLLLFSYVLGAYGTYLLTRDLLLRRRINIHGTPINRADDWAAFVAGLVFAFASSKLFYASLGQFNIASSQWIPFCVLYVTRIYPAPSQRAGLRSAAMAGLFLICQAWAELTYATFLFVFIALYLIYTVFIWLLDRRNAAQPAAVQSGFWSLFGRYALLALVTVAGLMPFLWAMVPDMLAEGDFFTSGGGFADVFSADLLGYLVPTRLHPFLGEWVAQLTFPNDKGQHLYIGYAALILAILGVVGLVRSQARHNRWEGWFWLFTTLFFWWMTLGAEIRWAGQSTGIPGPFALISHLPFFSGNRYPSRYSVMLMLCVAVLASYGLAWLFGRLPQRRTAEKSSGSMAALTVALIIGAMFLFEHLSTPLPLNDFRIPPIYEKLAVIPEEATVLELPTGWRNGARVLGRSDVLIMMQQWYQTEHGLRRLGGNTSRNPAYKFQYFSEAPLIGDLIALMNADRAHIGKAIEAEQQALIGKNRSIAPEVLDVLDISHVLIYVDHATQELLTFVDEVLPLTLVDEWQGDDWQGRPSTIRLYSVEDNDAQTSEREIDLASQMGNLYLAEGWSSLPSDGARYALRPSVDMMIDLPDLGGQLSLELAPGSTISAIAINGVGLPFQSTGDSWIDVTVPPSVGDVASDRLTLTFMDSPIPVNELQEPPQAAGWPIGETDTYLAPALALLVRSAGEETGNFAQIYVNGKNIAADSRGYNLVAMTDDGQLLDSVVFDTFASEEEADAMATWIDQWPDGTVMAGAVRDEASMNLNELGVTALRTIGVATDLRGQFRQNHAFAGVVGAEPGTALEASGVLRPSSVAVGPLVDGSEVYGGVGRIRFVP